MAGESPSHPFDRVERGLRQAAPVGSDKQERDPTLKELQGEIRQGFSELRGEVRAILEQLSAVHQELVQVEQDEKVVGKNVNELLKEIDGIAKSLKKKAEEGE